MPLSAPVPRRLLHRRIVQCWGYHRDDGLWDIEGQMVDTKTYPFPNEDRGGAIQAEEPLHDMWIRLTVDDQFCIHGVDVRTDAAPFGLCPAIVSRYQQLIGVRIGPGWSLKLRELFGGVRGCTHMTELLGPVATTMFQTVYGQRYDEDDAKSAEDRPPPPVLNTCHALSSDSAVVKKRWPKVYTGPDRETDKHYRPLLDDCLT
ncbi:MAG: DUF2889 domain-containing protein [Candidatus Competibacteraceae bacterium]|uniref:DUF2889 domain-containing protein n=1 Tax=Candidatus Contendobacter odensis Run_B_J11 TaxID=1400861 RepID=A0A7U7GFD1_9GAMM|nr:DUF2889 domain-containing protein [Candidatus Contendobacter odensis]MBK8536242.1 DUF2889 domain-containing protein [Candidatus Competibacteraceae bacterium]MBK8751371.1 DUF2889 domain-containing protein [Candidatus Competibacteraceae bacterium]CDH47351.1 conserved hypothetical protein [Candidatus Contendobacter odensis Run_B_J11]